MREHWSLRVSVKQMCINVQYKGTAIISMLANTIISSIKVFLYSNLNWNACFWPNQEKHQNFLYQQEQEQVSR